MDLTFSAIISATGVLFVSIYIYSFYYINKSFYHFFRQLDDNSFKFKCNLVFIAMITVVGYNNFIKFVVVFFLGKSNALVYNYYCGMTNVLLRNSLLLYQSITFYYLLDVDFEISANVLARLSLLRSHSIKKDLSKVTEKQALDIISNMNDSIAKSDSFLGSSGLVHSQLLASNMQSSS